MDFADLYDKYRFGETTNSVEGMHGVRRKYADKRLNFKQSYVCRANIAILCSYLPNWKELILEEMQISVTDYVQSFMKVTIFFADIIESSNQK